MCGSLAQRTSAGARMSAPPASPSHQVSQIAPKSDQLADPVSARLVTPTVALTAVLATAARRANLITSSGLSNARRPFAKRFTSAAATSPSSVFPGAMPSDESASPAVVRFTRNAPSRMPGQIRYPRSRNAAIAMPVGGQIAVALTWTKARVRPSLPATTYIAASTAMTRMKTRRSLRFSVGRVARPAISSEAATATFVWRHAAPPRYEGAPCRLARSASGRGRALHVERFRELREVLAADRDPVRPERIHEIDIHLGVGDGAEDRGERARTILDVDDDHLALRVHLEAGALDRAARRHRIPCDEVEHAVAGDGEAVDVDAVLAHGLRGLHERAGPVRAEVDGEIFCGLHCRVLPTSPGRSARAGG